MITTTLIVELGLSLLSHASLPLSFWDHAFVTAVYLINCLPSAPLNFNTPCDALFNTFPDCTFLKVFGSVCYPFLRPYNSHKLEFHSTECVFLGYSTSHKGYKCMSPSGRIYISKDVLFKEHRFSYPQLFSSLASSPSSPTPSPISTPLPIVFSNPVSLNSNSTPTESGQFSIPNESHHSPVIEPASSSSNESVNSESHSHQNQSTSSPEQSPLAAQNPTAQSPINMHPMVTRAKAGIVQPRINST